MATTPAPKTDPVVETKTDPVVETKTDPVIGEKVLMRAVFGRIVHPEKPEKQHELDTDRVTRVTFDWWHAIQYKAGKIAVVD